MRQKYPKYPANSGGRHASALRSTLANIERIDLALNFFRNLLAGPSSVVRLPSGAGMGPAYAWAPPSPSLAAPCFALRKIGAWSDE